MKKKGKIDTSYFSLNEVQVNNNRSRHSHDRLIMFNSKLTSYKIMKKKCKILLIMKLSTVLMMVFTLNISATGFGQLSFTAEGKKIRDVFQIIENKSNYRFFYNDDFESVDKVVNLNVTNLNIKQVLDKLLESSDFAYQIFENNLIVISQRDILQQFTVKGTVIDETGNPMPGVNIQVEGTTIGSVSDVGGKYSIVLPNADAVLIFSFIGYNSEKIAVGHQSTIDIKLLPGITKLDEVVVIGYGTMKKSDLSGSVASVKAADMTAYPSSQMLQALQGRASGVQIQATNGDPGSDYRVRVRGASSVNSSSDPLIVVDGFPGASMPASEDIESIEVLKDASATAIYGSRGANGVIMVSSKSGKIGKTKIELNSSYSIQNVIKRLDLLQTPDFINYMNDMTPGLLNPSGDYANTDWQNEVFRKGEIQNYQLAVSGGNENVRYYVSGIIFDQKGIVIDSKHKRYSITSNIDIHASKNLDIGINLFASRFSTDGVVTQEWSGGGGQTGVMSSTVLMEPIIPLYNPDGSYTTSSLTGQERDNPVAIAKEMSRDYVGDNLQANFYGEYKIAKDLKFRTTFGARTWSSRYGNYLPSTMYGGGSVGGRGNMEGYRTTDIVNENYLTLSKKLMDIHDISIMAGYSYQSFHAEDWGATSENYITDAFSYWNLGGGSVAKTPYSSLIESKLASFYGRLNYKLFDRYLITINARYDGSSRFAKNNKWAFFPSGAIAWNIAQENFMKVIPQISQFKLRISYGITGNQAIEPYQSLARLSPLPSTIINNTIVNSVAPSTVANENLTWESTSQTDIGLDLGFLNQRISITGDYYYKKTTDLLFSLPLPEYSGYTSLLKNIGSMENKGFEFTLSTVNFDGDFKWVTDFNLSRNRNKITQLPDNQDIFVDTSPGHMVGINNSQVMREGKPMGQFFGYIYDGVYQEGDTFLSGGGFEQVAGGEKFRDLNGDGKLDSDDRTIIGDPNPDIILGLNNTLEYKGFDMNFFFQASQGNDIYSFTLFELELMSGYYNSTTRALDRWTPTHTNTDVPKASDSRSKISSSRFVYDGSYIRLKNLSLGYRLPKSLIDAAGISFARIYISAQNMLTFTKYPGYDPEVSWMGTGTSGGNINLGLDYGSYPNAKSITVGVQVKF
jgi:TonB-dependent starch-binding outer membrane protein SusC